ncbi:vitamin B12 transporter [Filimonas zeae]|nr:TonB-dependent receptor [Filimonas zeae]MDR6337183.1 vitamin B12 transporter [Filimonas zeae]
MNKSVLPLSALLLLGVKAGAQDSLRTARLDEVIVTANKIAQKQNATGKVVSVISREQIEKSTGRTVAQLLNEQAGITINGALNNLGTNQSVYMRGASSGRTLILVDGIPVYDPSLSNSEFDLNLLALNDIERIEICRGAQSTLYGSDAIAGVINIITVRQDVDKPVNVKASLAGGSYGTIRGNAKVYGKAGKLSYNAGYAKLKSDGFSAAYDRTGNEGFDNDGYNGDALNASLQYQLSNELLLRGFSRYSRYKADIDNSAFIDEKDYVLKSKSLMTGGGFTFKKTGVVLNGNYQYSEFTRGQIDDSVYISPATKYFKLDYFGKAQFAELFANIELGKGFSLLQGADFRYSSMNSYSYYMNPGPVDPYNPSESTFKDTSLSQSSLYGSLLYSGINGNLNVELGGRLNVHSRYGSNHTYTFNPSYRINYHLRVFGSIATGFKAPTLYQLYDAWSGQPDLKPERSTNYEGGIQYQARNFRTRAVYFYRDIKDGLDYNYITYRYFNFGRQKVGGIELEATLQPAKGVTVTANYTWLHAQEQIQNRVNQQDTTYKYLLRRPDHNVNVTIGYNAGSRLYVSVSGKYVSKRYDIGAGKDEKLDPYFLLGAYAEYKYNSHIKIFADAQNLTNKKFFDVLGYRSIPFMFNGGVAINW